MTDDGLSEWDVIGKKPSTWEWEVAGAVYRVHTTSAHAYALEKLINANDRTTVNWRVVLNLLDIIERKEDENTEL